MLVTRTSFEGVLRAVRDRLEPFSLSPADNELMTVWAAIEVLLRLLPGGRRTARWLLAESRRVGLKVARLLAREDDSAFMQLLASKLEQQRRKLLKHFDRRQVRYIIDLAACWCHQRAYGQLSLAQLKRLVKDVAGDLVRTERFAVNAQSLLRNGRHSCGASTAHHRDSAWETALLGNDHLDPPVKTRSEMDCHQNS
jgi:hypothetical protein